MSTYWSIPCTSFPSFPLLQHVFVFLSQSIPRFRGYCRTWISGKAPPSPKSSTARGTKRPTREPYGGGVQPAGRGAPATVRAVEEEEDEADDADEEEEEEEDDDDDELNGLTDLGCTNKWACLGWGSPSAAIVCKEARSRQMVSHKHTESQPRKKRFK
jgi:hypothetical protein